MPNSEHKSSGSFLQDAIDKRDEVREQVDEFAPAIAVLREQGLIS